MTSTAPAAAPSVSVCRAHHNLIDVARQSLANHLRILGDAFPCVKAVVDFVLELAACLEVIKHQAKDKPNANGRGYDSSNRHGCRGCQPNGGRNSKRSRDCTC